MENPRHIIRRTKVKGYEQRELVTEDVNLVTGEVKVVKIEHYDWEKDTERRSRSARRDTDRRVMNPAAQPE